MLKKIIFGLLCLTGLSMSVSAQSSGSVNSIQKKLIKFTPQYTVTSYKSGSIVLFTPRKGGLDSNFYLNGVTATRLEDLSNNPHCALVNGFYFGKGIDSKFQPAGPVTFYKGLTKEDFVVPSTTDPELDVNLKINVFYNSINNIVSFNTPIKISHGISFFAGPMILEDGVANPNLTKRISHRSTKHYRTFIIRQPNKKAIFGITTTKISLPDLATDLQAIMRHRKISVVNLDGGSSTSMLVPGFSYNEDKVLPAWFSMCKKRP